MAQPPLGPSFNLPAQPVFRRSRGTFLSLMLGLTVLVNVAVLLLFMWSFHWLDRMAARAWSDEQVLHIAKARKLFTLGALSCAGDIVFAMAMWGWRKWGVLGYAVFSFGGFFAALGARSPGLNAAGAFLGLLCSVLVLLAAVRKWSYFE